MKFFHFYTNRNTFRQHGIEKGWCGREVKHESELLSNRKILPQSSQQQKLLKTWANTKSCVCSKVIGCLGPAIRCTVTHKDYDIHIHGPCYQHQKLKNPGVRWEPQVFSFCSKIHYFFSLCVRVLLLFSLILILCAVTMNKNTFLVNSASKLRIKKEQLSCSFLLVCC